MTRPSSVVVCQLTIIALILMLVEEQSSSLSYMHRVQCYRSAVKLDYLIIAFQVKRWSKDGSVKTVVFCLLKVTVTYCRSFTLYCMHIEMASAAY